MDEGHVGLLDTVLGSTNQLENEVRLRRTESQVKQDWIILRVEAQRSTTIPNPWSSLDSIAKPASRTTLQTYAESDVTRRPSPD